MSVTYPSGYGTRERTLDDLMNYHCPTAVTEPEFRRRLRHFIESKHGVIGIGDRLPRPWGHNVSGASASNRSFHQQQRMGDGTEWAMAVDLVVRRPGLGHSSGHVPWTEVPRQGSQYAADWGVHCNIDSESWHMQAIEIDGFYRWTQAGRPRPVEGFHLPCQPEPNPDPVIVFDPRNGKWGLWPVNPDKPRLSTREFMEQRQTYGDNRWRWTGDAVLYLQGVLNWHVGIPTTIDGYFGPQTRANVIEFQGDGGLTADGLVGPQTWTAVDARA